MKKSTTKTTKKLEIVPESTNTRAVIDNLLKDFRCFKKLFADFQTLRGCRYHTPPLPGIYFISTALDSYVVDSFDQIIYIGMSSNLKKLWENHPKITTFQKLEKILLGTYNHKRDSDKQASQSVWVHFWCNPFMTDGQLYEIESYLISQIKPLLNETTTSLSIIKSLPMTLDVEMEEIDECPL